MKNLRHIKHDLARFFRLFMHFQKPTFEELEVCDLVIEQEPLLVIYWNMRYRYLLQIGSTKFRSSSRQGTHIIKLPDGMRELKIVLQSGWRRSIFRFQLSAIPAPPEVLDVLVKGRRLNDLPTIEDFKISTEFRFRLEVPNMLSKMPDVNLKIPNMDIAKIYYPES